MTDATKIVSLTTTQRAAWGDLYADYAKFYRTSLSAESAALVWRWIADGQLSGVAAETQDGVLCGFAHWQKVLRPLHACTIAYLHDLFVHPSVRGKGIGDMLIAAAGQRARAEGCDMMRWATAADNKTAMRLYDRIAAKTSWVIYDKQLGDNTQ